MVGHASERHRKSNREVHESSEKKEVEEIESPEKVELETRELQESISDAELRLRDAMTELKVRESREEKISQGLEEAIGELRKMESRKETTESKIKAALEEIEDPVNDVELQSECRSKNDELREDAGKSEHKEEVEKFVPEDNIRIETNEEVEEIKESIKDAEPELEDNLPNKSGATPKDSGIRYREIHTQEEFDIARDRYADLELRGNYEDQLVESKKYFENSEEGKDTPKPDLVKEIEEQEIRRLYETVHDGPPQVKIESMHDVDKFLEDYPNEKERKRFDEQYRHCKVYFDVKDQHEVRREDLAKEYNVSHTYIGYWRGGVEPTLIRELRGREEERKIKEWIESVPQISEENLREFNNREKITPKEMNDDRTGVHKLNVHVVQEATSDLRERDSILKEDIVKTAEMMNQPRLSESVRIRYGNLRGELTPEKISEIQRVLHENYREIEEAASKKLGLEDSRVRIAMVNEKLYTWSPKVRNDELVSAYEDQFYYFKDRREVVRIAEELQTHLGIDGNRRESLKRLNEVTRQLTVGDNGEHSKAEPIGGKIPRLEGKVIRMYLDSTNQKLSDLEGRVKKVTGINGQAGIENPKFPEGKNLEVLKARLISVIASDCHLRPSGSITYYEEYPERILRVQEILREFGDIPLEPEFRKGVYDVHIRNQIGLIVIDEGMTPGDKTIQNPGLPESYKHWSEEARGAYLEELICEDGNFSKSRGFSWYRNHALHDSNEQGKYDFKSMVTPEEIELIKEEGNQSKGLVPQYDLSKGELDRQCESDNPERSKIAQSLRDAISNSPNNLIQDEKKIAESLGIRINLSPSSVKYYPKSGRVSVKYTATTESNSDAIRWGTMYPPNDVRKRKEVDDWLNEVGTE